MSTTTTTCDTITIPEAAGGRRRRMFGRLRVPDRGQWLPVERPVVPPVGPVTSLR